MDAYHADGTYDVVLEGNDRQGLGEGEVFEVDLLKSFASCGETRQEGKRFELRVDPDLAVGIEVDYKPADVDWRHTTHVNARVSQNVMDRLEKLSHEVHLPSVTVRHAIGNITLRDGYPPF